MSSSLAYSALRRLVRAKNAAFKGDAEMLRSAQAMIREQFGTDRDASPEEVPEVLKRIDEAVEFLEQNVVQAPLNERGNYTVDANRVDESKRL